MYIFDADPALSLVTADAPSDVDPSGVGLERALAIPELRAAAERLQEVQSWVRGAPHARMELQSSLRKQELDKNRLTKEFAHLEAHYEAIITQLKETNKVQKLKLDTIEQSGGPALTSTAVTHQVTSLERALAQETREKERLTERVRALQEENEVMSKHLRAATQDMLSRNNHTHTTTLQNTNQSIGALTSTGQKEEIATLEQENKELRAEIQAISHHRGILKQTIEQVEKQLRLKSEDIAEITSQRDVLDFQYRKLTRDGDGDVMGDNDDDDVLRKQCNRFRARSLAMEELLSIYRASVMALYPDGSTYGAAQFQAFTRPLSTGTGGNGAEAGVTASLQPSKWIEREMQHVRKSYEDEIRVLDGEVNELRTKLKQSGSYVSELRKRFEENLKTLYRQVL